MIVTGRWLTQVLRTDEVTHTFCVAPIALVASCKFLGPLGVRDASSAGDVRSPSPQALSG